MPSPQLWLRRLPSLLLLAATIGVVACVLVVLCGRVAAGLDPERARAAVSRGIESGAIPDSDTPEAHGRRGPHPFNECLIYMMAALPSGAPWRDAVEPLAPRNVVLGVWDVKVCAPLADWAQSGQIGIEVAGYGRYLHGHRLIAALALGLGGVAVAPILLSITAYTLLILILARNAVNLARRGWQNLDERTRRLGLCVVALAFLLCYGLPLFSPLLSHGPADIGLFSFILFASGRDFVQRPARERVAAVACFGAWAATFEFLSGPLPMLVAAVLLVHGMSPRMSARILLSRAALAVAALLVAFMAAFAAKQGALLLLSEGALPGSSKALLRWIGESRAPGAPPPPTLMTLINVVRWKLPDLYAGSTALAYAVAFLSAAQILVGTVVLLAKCPRESARLLLLVAPLLVVSLWYVALPSHTAIHINFMVRLTVWLPLVGWVVTLFALFRMLAPVRQAVESGRA